MESKIEQAKQYIDDNLLKQVFKQKGYEAGAVLIFCPIIWYVPYWLGLLFAKIVGDDFLLYLANVEVLTRGDYWFPGFIILLLMVGFVAMNIITARDKLEARAAKKFNVARYDL